MVDGLRVYGVQLSAVPDILSSESALLLISHPIFYQVPPIESPPFLLVILRVVRHLWEPVPSSSAEHHLYNIHKGNDLKRNSCFGVFMVGIHQYIKVVALINTLEKKN